VHRHLPLRGFGRCYSVTSFFVGSPRPLPPKMGHRSVFFLLFFGCLARSSPWPKLVVRFHPLCHFLLLSFPPPAPGRAARLGRLPPLFSNRRGKVSLGPPPFARSGQISSCLTCTFVRVRCLWFRRDRYKRYVRCCPPLPHPSAQYGSPRRCTFSPPCLPDFHREEFFSISVRSFFPPRKVQAEVLVFWSDSQPVFPRTLGFFLSRAFPPFFGRLYRVIQSSSSWGQHFDFPFKVRCFRHIIRTCLLEGILFSASPFH